MIVNKWDSILTSVLEAVEIFIKETSYPITYNMNNAINWLYGFYQDTDSDIIVNIKDNKIRGFAIVMRDHGPHTEYFGYFHKFYVIPEHRGTTAARELAKECTDWFDQHDCMISFATATAGVGEDKLFVNLLRKFGYENMGMATLVRKRHE